MVTDNEFVETQKTEAEELTNRLIHEMNNNLAIIKVKTYLVKKNARAGTLRASDLEEHLESISDLSDRIAGLVKRLRECNQSVA